MGTVLSSAKSDLNKCESLDGDIQKIGAWGSNVIKNPKSIIQNILANGSDIIKEVPASPLTSTPETTSKLVLMSRRSSLTCSERLDKPSMTPTSMPSISESKIICKSYFEC